ncbi:MAG: glycoside hydrolase family 13 protein [Flavobacteriales bacterium]
MEYKSVFMKWSSLFFVMMLVIQAHSQVLQHVEPSNWWVGMEHHQVQVLLHGPQIAKYKVEVSGLSILEEVRTENPNYIFITLETQGKVAGEYPIRLLDKKKIVATHPFTLLVRKEASKYRNSFSSEDVLYLLMPDRFANGDPLNDNASDMKEQANQSSPGGRHGGDLKGVQDRLTYIKDLGATTIWMTPFLEDNEPVYSYHGYAQSDLYKVDPRYGSNESFKTLVASAHQLGLKVIKDEVPNHWSSKHWMIQDLPTSTWIHQFEQFTRSSYRTTTQFDPYAAKSDQKASADGWFDTTMPDMNQNNPMLLTYLIQNTIWWIEWADLDGLRVDTYSYNDKDAIATWTKAIMTEYPNLNIVGEVWMHDQAQMAFWQKDSPIGALQHFNSNMPSVMDFTLHDAISQAFREKEQGWDQGVVRFYENFTQDYLYANPKNLLVFIENHDTQRFNESYPSFNDYKLAMTLIATTRGIPQIYYGSEIGMRGSKAVGDADIRRDFFKGTTVEERTPDQEAYFQFTKNLLNWRKDQNVIHDGELLQYVPQNNVYVYFRYLEPEKTLSKEAEVVMVILNNSEKDEELNWARFSEGLHDFEFGNDVLTNQTFDFEQKSGKIPAKTAYIIQLKNK